jgi:tRNA U34 5-methylaminomethyl-2-thiouridine-forming methyltransferase MnmC
MTWLACGAEPPAEGRAGAAEARSATTGEGAEEADLKILRGGDGSFSLWSSRFAEAFHSGRGALREARETFVGPSQLERFGAGQRLRVLEVCVGTGTNLAALLEACTAVGLELEWWGLELDPAPLALALAQAEFRSQWQPQTLSTLDELLERGHWRHAQASGQLFWGDARRRLPELVAQRRCKVDLVWHDAFSPQRCPQLWSIEVLGSLAALLAPGGRWISYCSAAAVREGLRLANLQLAALATPDSKTVPQGPQAGGSPAVANGSDRADHRRAWSGGTIATVTELEPTPLWRSLSAMEREHLGSGAGEPYRDPTGSATPQTILDNRRGAQAAALASGRRSSSRAWRKRWGVAGREAVVSPMA